MPSPYSMDLRSRVLADCDAGLSTSTVALKYRVRTAWVRRLKQRRRQTGETQPRKGRPGPKPHLAHREAALRDLVAAQPDLSAGEYRGRLGVACCALTVWRALRRLGLTFKKSNSRRRAAPARCGRPPRAVAPCGDAQPGSGAAGVPR